MDAPVDPLSATTEAPLQADPAFVSNHVTCFLHSPWTLVLDRGRRGRSGILWPHNLKRASKGIEKTHLILLILLDSPLDPALSSTRRTQRAAQHASSMSKNLWERRVVIAQERITQLEAQAVERDATHARVQAENARLVERERSAREGKVALEAVVRGLKVSELEYSLFDTTGLE
jgi:hypothetical protein